MESQRKKPDLRVENLTARLGGSFAGRLNFPAPVSMVGVPFAGLNRESDGADVQQLAGFYLGEEERGRFAAFRYAKRRNEWLAGRIAAKCAALQLINHAGQTHWPAEQWQQVQISADQAGKPYLVLPAVASRQMLPAISISHSHGLAVAMAAQQPCGIDIQRITTAIERVAERFVAAGEQEILAPVIESHGRLAALTLLWSAKEAVKKTAACGQQVPDFLGISLTERQGVGGGFRFAVQVTEGGGGAGRQQLVWLQLLDDFALAVTIHHGAETS